MGGKFTIGSEASKSLDVAPGGGQTTTTNQDVGTCEAMNSAVETGFDDALSGALKADRIADARTLVANAEAILMAHKNADRATPESPTSADLAAAKARIAIATGDGPAARAILVQAIERNPKVAALRSLMTEAMLADGRASDVRPVLQHLGKVRRDVPRQTPGSGAAMRDTS